LKRQANGVHPEGKSGAPGYAIATIGGVPAGVQFAGSAPGFAGLIQINAQVPTSVAPGNYVSVAITIGGRNSQPGITIAVN
jgi:uncharacterized protein (TIGR03437 family)